ncbi:hypothetical protein LIER_10092 [Lithospermum erythrorhizon]|uniref:Uncharacterized protein n=1 Tax=Lithospermum erythrorhizon TaxID=34254 RepID=A0AAV3PHZ7_LITER
MYVGGWVRLVHLKTQANVDGHNDGVFGASRNGSVIHCKICGAHGHNARSPRRSLPSIVSKEEVSLHHHQGGAKGRQ